MGAARRIDGQRQVGVDLAQEKIRTGLAGNEIGVLADPAEAGVAGQSFLQHRRAVDEHATTVRLAELGDKRGQALEALAQYLVIIAAERVARHVAAGRIAEHVARVSGLRWPVIHARADDAYRARHELGRAAALAAVALHVMHLPVPVLGQPAEQVSLIGVKLNAAHADRGKTELDGALRKLRAQSGPISRLVLRHGRSAAPV